MVEWHASFDRMRQKQHVLLCCPQAVGEQWGRVVDRARAGDFKPWAHQEAAATWSRERMHWLFAASMGTGKSLMALLSLGLLGADIHPVILTAGTGKKRAETLQKALATAGTKTLVVIANYDAVWRGELAAAVQGVKWKAIVLDESHRIKSPAGKQSRWLFNLARKQPLAKRVLLTGTPMPHALAVTEPVLTPDGFRLMGAISVGDQVIGSDGKPTKVAGVWPQGRKQLYRVAFSDGASVECTADHLWTVSTRGRDSRKLPPLVLRTDELDRALPHPNSNPTGERGVVCGVNDAHGAPRFSIPFVGPVEFTKRTKPLPLDPYVLGALLGDGCLQKPIDLTTADEGIYQEVKRRLPVGVHLIARGGNQPTWNGRATRFRLTSGIKGGSNKGAKRGPPKTAVQAAIEGLGLFGTDSFTKFIPEEYLHAAIEDRIALLQGLCDTDGHSCGGTTGFTTISPNLAAGVRYLVQSLGGDVHWAEQQPRATVLPQGTTCLSRLQYKLYFRTSFCPFALERKAAKWHARSLARRRRRGVVAVEKSRIGEAQCITVEAADGLFVADQFVVTHNSPLDIWAQYRFLDVNVFGPSFTKFRARYADCDRMFPSKVKKWINQEELTRKIDEHAWRVTADEVLTLPEAIHESLPVTLSAATMRYYRDIEREMVAAIGDGTVTCDNGLVKLLRLQEATSGRARLDDSLGTTPIDGTPAKRMVLQEWLEDLPVTEPVVVFAKFRGDLDDIAAVARELGRGYSEVSGREKSLAAWQAGDTTILGVQIQSGGTGLDLFKACFCAYYSLGFSLGEYEQSLARLHRPGQTRCVRYYHLVAKGTVDEAVYAALRERRNVVEAVLSRLSPRKEVMA